MSPWKTLGAAALLMSLRGCSDSASEESPPTTASRQELLCSDMCETGAGCGMLDGCMSPEDCRSGCLDEYAQVQTPEACLDAIETFHACFWQSLSCVELSNCSGSAACGNELDAIRPACDVTGTGFDKDRYVLVPLMCVCGAG
jgi:hypothetical protein